MRGNAYLALNAIVAKITTKVGADNEIDYAFNATADVGPAQHPSTQNVQQITPDLETPQPRGETRQLHHQSPPDADGNVTRRDRSTSRQRRGIDTEDAEPRLPTV